MPKVVSNLNLNAHDYTSSNKGRAANKVAVLQKPPKATYLLNQHELPHDTNSIFSGPGHESVGKCQAFLATTEMSSLPTNLMLFQKQAENALNKPEEAKLNIASFLKDYDAADILNQ